MNLATIVGHVGGPCKGESAEQDEWENEPAESVAIKSKIKVHVEEIFQFVDRANDERRFDEVERGLRTLLFALGRLFLAYFLARREERSGSLVGYWLRRRYRRADRERKFLGTFFGRVTFWRTHVRPPRRGAGMFPLDRALGLTADGFSLLVTESAARLSTLVSFEQVTALFLHFQMWSPSKTTVEKAVLGFGRHTAEWFEAAPAPKRDGEVLVIQIDSKATPTATEEELEKRRGKRKSGKRALSPRHRGREKRGRRGEKKRRKKGDHSKNGKAATLVVMYTLKKGRDENGKPVLLGPINKRVYASYAPKRHAFVVARREAAKRGFNAKSGKRIHILTDGDGDLERYVKDFFPKACHTVDIVHVLEYFWEAGRFVYKEGSDELASWAKKQEKLLYAGKASRAVLNLNELEVSPTKRKRLEKIKTYLSKRIRLMNYDELRKKDLDVATGVVEGAVRHVIAKRFDSSGMRWIRERAEALLQLRCVEINGDWDAFVSFVARRIAIADADDAGAPRLLTNIPEDVPSYGLAI
jgi:hypothetical protein